MTLYKWSQTASSDATADSTINWAEGQAPSSVNDSARAMMAATAKYRDDIAGAIVTSGTSTAYTVSSYQVFDTLAHISGQMIAFTPHATNGATVTLNVDSLGAKPLRTAPNTELLAGVIIQGTPYAAVYNNSDGAFYLRGYFGTPYNVPILGGMDFWDTVTPNSSFIFPAGQAISRTTYAYAFSRWGTEFGAGDGSTTFNVPDKRGLVSAACDNMGGIAAGRLTTAGFGGGGAGSIGATGGAQTEVLTLSHLPNFTPSGTVTSTSTGTSQVQGNGNTGANTPNTAAEGTNVTALSTISLTITTTSSFAGNGIGGNASHPNVQPTICCNYIIRII